MTWFSVPHLCSVPTVISITVTPMHVKRLFGDGLKGHLSFILNSKCNQRTNGPINAHLISRPTISTKTSFAKFDIVLKWGQGQFRAIIYINFVELENIILHAKFHDHMTISSVWAWWPSWSCDLDHLHKLCFPLPKEAPHEIWL